ncbi:MAG: transglycosylase SLT domain-containing protein [Alphaproteobacteria bacterium]|nr:transglycosylase SLT domain-containing protein [Alphaproteobacteria bacterium]
MSAALKSLENNALAALSARAPSGIKNAIQTASAKTGVDFAYLMEKAAAESNFNPTVKAKTSSATGLFQFIDSTWMGMVKKHGAKYGIDANQDKQSLLSLRKDPQIASYMAAEFAKGNKEHLEKTVGGNIRNTELYFAHFMGAGGASAFLNQLKQNPNAIGANIFPKEANANRNVFYDPKTSQPRSLQEIYNFFDKKFSNESGPAESAPVSLAHKPEQRTNSLAHKKSGYQHIPPSLKKPVEVYDTASHVGSLYQVQQQIDAFFSQPTNMFPSSWYGNLSGHTSLLLSVLK